MVHNTEIPKRWRFTAYPTGVEWGTSEVDDAVHGRVLESGQEYAHPKFGVIGALITVHSVDGEWLEDYFLEYDPAL